MTRRKPNRPGFTLVELMVAAALSLIIMAILATAFQKGIDTFRVLKAAGNMQDRLRAATTVLKRDLAAEHFGGQFRPGFSGPYVADQRLDRLGWYPPEQGFFALRTGAASVSEGADGNGLPSYAGATGTELHFTVKLPGNRPENMFTAFTSGGTAPPANLNNTDYVTDSTTFATPWAEVAYFLVQPGGSLTTDGGKPLFTLYRRQRLLVPGATATTLSSGLPDISTNSATVVNTPATITTLSNRLASPFGTSTLITGTQQGDDILLSDVLSFEVKPTWQSSTELGTTISPTLPPFTAEPDYPFASLPTSNMRSNARVFDTHYVVDTTNTYNWNDLSSMQNIANAAKNAPLRIRITTLQIRIRIWDAKAQIARQVTIIQDI